MKQIPCPHCGEISFITDDQPYYNCSRCGAVMKINVEVDYRKRVYVDEARIRESDNKTHLKEKEMDIENQRYLLAREDAKAEVEHQRDIKKTLIVVGAVLLVSAIIFLVALSSINKFRHLGDVKMPVSESAYVGEDYNSVITQLVGLGFDGIKLDEHADLTMSEQYAFGKVTEITINGVTSFKKGTWFDKDSPIKLTYHTVDPARQFDIQVPGSSYSLSGNNYRVVEKQFLDAGFSNIKFEAVDDVTLFTKDYSAGDVFEVTINGSSDFYSSDYFPKDANVLICLHADSNLVKQIDLINGRYVEIPKKASDYKGLGYSDVKKQFETIGFDDIKLEALDDLSKKDSEANGQVAEVLINGDSGFRKGDSFSAENAEVIIRYHSISDENLNQIQINKASSSFKGEQVQSALDYFDELSFENVLAVPLNDLDSSSDKKNGVIESVELNGTEIKKNGYYSPEAQIIISYHSVSEEAFEREQKYADERQGKIVMPKGSAKYLGSNYQKVESELKELGFSDITFIPLYDIKTFEIWRKGNVIELSIDGSTKFMADDYFAPDAQVVITYHATA